MNAISHDLIGKGLYSAPEASSLTGVPSASIRRWLGGYKYRQGDKQRASAPVWQGDIPRLDTHLVLSFLDMMEVRFIQSFRQHHVSWAAIREAAERACEMFGDHHPFTRGRFRTDGNRIFHQIQQQGDVRLFDINRRSWVFNDIVEPSLYRGVELADDQVARWYPMHPNRHVVVDPRIAFGRPILAEEGVPTDIIAAAVAANGSDVSHVAKWYGVKPQSVRAAVAFEQSRHRAA
jgi:uncharacterized protein (DUF433 family)